MAKESLETRLIGGVEKRNIEIVAYDADWLQKFERHARIIAAALGSVALQIEHIGSTAVPALAAKPIIDILVVVADSADESSYLSQLQAAGYVLRVREPNWHKHRMFRTPDLDVHIHVYSAGCPEIERHLTFRNRLRKDETARNLYERTKRELATHDWPDMNAYANAKTEVVESILASTEPADAVCRPSAARSGAVKWLH